MIFKHSKLILFKRYAPNFKMERLGIISAKYMLRSLRQAVVIIIFLLALCIPSFLEATDQVESEPIFRDVSVHDPSVYVEDGTAYVIGSHLASAYTKDWIDWQQYTIRVSDNNPLIKDPYKTLSEVFQWAQSTTLWAGDWIYLPEADKYFMYYCACKGDSPRSALGYVTADSILGPYDDSHILLKSGDWGQEGPDGQIYDPVIHPNAIDPHVFFDKNERLWMVYGSYSGGIFILEMDAKTGTIIPDQGWGTKLIGGGHAQVEGPYILYSPHTGYYYLFLSYGGLDSKGGYNLRVARSKNPAGPYFDRTGQNIESAHGELTQLSKYGQKIFGNHAWQNEISNTLKQEGYVSPGHNSAYYDSRTDKYFIIFHTRLPERGELHQVRVHQIFFDEEGWPLIAPFRYSGEELGSCNSESLNGIYQIVNLKQDSSSDIHQAEYVALDTSGAIEGKKQGTWELLNSENGFIQLVIEEVVYQGFVLRQWNPVRGEVSSVLTMINEDGESLLGVASGLEVLPIS